jgi:KaiC/GvpD/RAD55 family RecA-like ATPase
MGVLPVDVPGLNLVLGGGIPAVRRSDEPKESATLLVRGPPGSGKSIFGTQLADALARVLRCDVAYGCVELLPHELRAQQAAFGRSVEQVVVPPFTGRGSRADRGVCIFAATLDLGDARADRDKLGGATLELLEAVEACAGKPGVLVIDSLSDGYGLGASAPRELADGVCKMAAELGMFVILLEETVDGRPSNWSFATDIVFELGVRVDDSPRGADRSMTVLKNRFAPSDQGPHELIIDPSRGVRIFPRPSCYLVPWAKELVFPYRPLPSPSQAWGIPVQEAGNLAPFNERITAVYGSDTALVFDVVRQLGRTDSAGQVAQGYDLFVDFGRQGPGAFDPPIRPEAIVWAGDPYLSGNRLLEEVVGAISTLLRNGAYVRRVLIGDFRSIRTFSDPATIRRAVGVLIALLRRAGIPAILFETTASRLLLDSRGGLVPAPDAQEPAIVDFADVLIEVTTNRMQARAVLTNPQDKQSFTWLLEPPDLRQATPVG